MNFDFKRGWNIHSGSQNHPFDAKAPYVDNGVGRGDPERYSSIAYMAQEWERMWTKTWLLAGPVCDVREPGDYFRFDIGRESFIVVRGDDGVVRAHYNVCPHRGSRLIVDDFGSMGRFTCPFHSWKFALDGKNVEVTDRETFRAEVLCHDLDLTSVRCEVVAGLVFISMKPDIEPARDWLGVVADHLDAYEIDRMNVIQHKQSDWAANWKVGVDAFYETYHLHAIHPQTQGVMDDRNQFDLYPNGMSRMYIPFAQPAGRHPDQTTVNEGIKMMLRDAGIDPDTYAGTAQETRKAIQAAKRARAPSLGLDYSRFSDDQLTDSVPYGLFPNVQLGCHPEGVFMMRFLPDADDPAKFVYDNIILYRHVEDTNYKVPAWMGLPEGIDTSGDMRPDVVRVPHGAPPDLGEVLDQDTDLVPIVHAGSRSRGFRGPLWSEQELRLRHFHAELDRYLNNEK